LKQEASPLGRQGMLPVFIVPAVEKGKTFSGRRDRLAGIVGVVVLERIQLRASCFLYSGRYAFSLRFRYRSLFLTVPDFFVDAGFYGYHLQVKIRPADLPGLPVKNLDVQFAFFSDGTGFFDCCRRYRNDGAADLPCSMGTLHNTAHTRNTFFSVCCLRVIPADRLGRTLDGAHSAPDTFFSGLGNQTCPARLFVGAVAWNRWR